MTTVAAQPDTKSLRTPFEVKAVDTEARTFEGLASTWDKDLGGDVIHEGAFKQTLTHWRESGRVLPLIDQHNYGSVRSVVGKMLEAEETDEGLWSKWEIIEGADGDEVMARLKGGYVDGLSIGYRAVKVEYPDEEEEAEGIFRHLKEVELREVSVVIWPMNPDARIDTESIKKAVRAFEGRDLTDDERQELTQLQQKIAALLEEEAPTLAPDDPQRLELDSKVRRIRLGQLRPGATR